MERIVNTIKNGWLVSLTVFIVGVLVLRDSLPEPDDDRAVSRWVVLGPRLRGSWTPDFDGGLAGSSLELQPGPWGESAADGSADEVDSDSTVEPDPERDRRQPVDKDPVPPGPGRAPQYEAYRVQDRDSYWAIARRLLGAGHRCTEIEALNPDIPAKKLRAGMSIRVPAMQAKSGQRTGPRSASSRPKEHCVKNGESLSGIAAQYYKDAGWRRIYDANRDRVKDPDRLRSGVVLRLPDGAWKDLW